MSEPLQHIDHCSSCGCKMDISSMDPYTNVVCPDCGHHTRVKCDMGHYLLTSRHAVGGMSMVFVARDTTLERDVAIKVLNEEYSRDAKRMEEFEHEAKITAALSHPHVVRVFTVGKTFDHYYIAMELVAGENLEEKISKNGAVGEEEMLPIALEIISGLRAAKSAGVIHRDMKPGNILFDEAGHVKIVDFGLALVTMGGKAKAEEIWATPYYVPPEALDGEDEDFRSDIYALGSTLYHALSGKPPLPPEAKSTREVRKAKEHIAPLAEAAPWLNPATCHLVDKAMALRPEDRFDSYAKMEEAWNMAFQTMRGGGAEPPIHSEGRLRRRVNDTKGLVRLVITGVVSLALVAVVLSFFFNGEDDASPPPAVAINDGEALADAGFGQSNTSQGGGYDPEVASRIGRLFRISHQSMKNKKYDDAQRQFRKLIEDPGIKEPLSSWARVEAMIVSWLKADYVANRQAQRALTQHLESSHSEQSPSMLELGRLLRAPNIITEQNVNGEPMAVVQLIATGLKNWEIGAWDKAVPLFKKAKTHPLPLDSPLMVYRDIAHRYLSDYKRLQPLIGQAAPSSIKEGRARIDTLKKKLGQLETNGRARFHVRVWQFRLLRQIKRLEAVSGPLVAVVGKSGFDQLLSRFKIKLSEGKFAQASELLQSASFEGSAAERKELCASWVYLADSSSVFLMNLESAVPEGGLAISIQSKKVDGKVRSFSKIVSAKSGGLQLTSKDGDAFLPWSEIASDSVISIFQSLMKPNLSSPEGQMQTELAICYAWLTGMEDKARGVAGKLSDVNRGFGKRWSKTMRIIDTAQ